MKRKPISEKKSRDELRDLRRFFYSGLCKNFWAYRRRWNHFRSYETFMINAKNLCPWKKIHGKSLRKVYDDLRMNYNHAPYTEEQARIGGLNSGLKRQEKAYHREKLLLEIFKKEGIWIDEDAKKIVLKSGYALDDDDRQFMKKHGYSIKALKTVLRQDPDFDISKVPLNAEESFMAMVTRKPQSILQSS